MKHLMTPGNIRLALSRLEPELPSLAGDEGWAVIQGDLNDMINRLGQDLEPSERPRLAAAAVEMIAPYPNLRERVRKEIYAQTAVLNEIEADLEGFATGLAIDMGCVEPSAAAAMTALRWVMEPTEALRPAESSNIRVLQLKPSGLGGGKSIKLSNLHLDLPTLIELGAGVTATGADIIGQPHPLIIAAGVLLIIDSLTKAITVKLSEREASVFWGFIQAVGKGETAHEAVIAKLANVERKKVGLAPLAGIQVKNALHILKTLKTVESVERKPCEWRIIESYKINAVIK